jgi:hypothetical protein
MRHFVPYFIGQPVKIGEINPMRYAGIIDQYVQAPELPADLLDHATHLRIALDIGLNRECFHSGALQIGDKLLGLLR